ncbi:MAG: hypothetical protein ACJASL_000896 [Paraglaciecola sp.]|jgi:hypothetical protein
MILKEPLIHFLALGLLLFVAFDLVNDDAKRNEQFDIVVTEQQTQQLVKNWQRVWNREPTSKEVAALVENYVQEEILYREALALGLDKKDGIVRRRLSQKMQFITEDVISVAPPSDATLQQYLDNNHDTYRRHDRYSFSQVYIDPNKHKGELDSFIDNTLQQLSNSNKLGADKTPVGDRLMIDSNFNLMTINNIEKQFGDKFIKSLKTIEQEKWQGPIVSGYGLHLVNIKAFQAGSVPLLSDIRHIIERDWATQERIKLNDSFYQSLRERYSIKVNAYTAVPDQPDRPALAPALAMVINK